MAVYKFLVLLTTHGTTHHYATQVSKQRTCKMCDAPLVAIYLYNMTDMAVPPCSYVSVPVSSQGISTSSTSSSSSSSSAAASSSRSSSSLILSQLETSDDDELSLVYQHTHSALHDA